ncbi:carbamate kinase [Anaerococcus sp. WCA-380-WT-2B]|uniref:Carbamate kinase n=1 Tax=Anaerococcus porci TaxID=2652269 RepID=A0A6N7VV73_9FIRM|nr:carbamate kinase [Anaerococcus porci]MSS77924.1 carbamate kinase [Anaerococcus porci]
MSYKIVIALGGNALGSNVEEQKEAVKKTSEHLVDLVMNGNKIIVGHGNGPQVGMINLAMEEGHKNTDKIPLMPFPECGAMSQGYIGYHLQNAIHYEFKERGREVPVVTVITQVIVDENDEAFKNPTKPIGSFYTKEEAEEIAKKTGYQFKEDSGRGYRRVVASPFPKDIVEKDSLKSLYDARNVIIACGGGGIPLIKDGLKYKGVDAVIDKDFSCALLADLMEADVLLILTAVEKVAINFGKEDEKWLDKMTIDDCNKYIEQGQFAPGSMLPKVEAAMQFVKGKSGRKAVITSLEKALDAMSGKTGTWIE